MLKSKISDVLLLLFGLFWIVFIFSDYINKHPFYGISIEHFQFKNYAAFILFYVLVHGLLFKFIKPKHKKYFFNGLGIIATIFIASIATTYSYVNFSDGENNFGTSIVFAANAIKYLAALILIFISVSSIGNLTFKIVNFDIRESSRPVYEVVFGIMVITFIMFLLAMLGLLNQITVLAFLLLPIIINIKSNIGLLKGLFLSPIIPKTNQMNFLTGILFGTLVIFLTMNFLGAMSPFPLGFDSRNYYVNISKLLGDYNGVVKGFQSYSWSIFMAIGNIGFKSITLTLLLSFSGILLSLWALWELARNYLHLKVNQSWAVLLIVSLMPAFFNQMYIELKVDFGLLFVQVCNLLLLIDTVDNITKGDKFSFDADLYKLLILLGVFFGFALGIKATHLYMIFAIMMFLWTVYCQFYGFLACFAAIFSLILFGHLDDVSGMGSYHLGSYYLKYILLAATIIFGALSFVKYKEAFLASMKTSVIVSVVSLMVFMPWILKHYSESKTTNINSLIIGNSPGPEVTIWEIIENYNRHKRGNE